MSVACGKGVTAIVTNNGNMYTFGKSKHGQLTVGELCQGHAKPVLVDRNQAFDGEAVVMVSFSSEHSACITYYGSLWTWGDLFYGALGIGQCLTVSADGRTERKLRPERVRIEHFGDSPAIVVSCGELCTCILTAAGQMWMTGVACSLNRHDPGAQRLKRIIHPGTARIDFILCRMDTQLRWTWRAWCGHGAKTTAVNWGTNGKAQVQHRLRGMSHTQYILALLVTSLSCLLVQGVFIRWW